MDVDALLARVLRQSAVLLVADARGVVLYASERSSEVMSNALVGESLEALFAGEGGMMDELWPTLRAGGTWTGAIARKDPSGGLSWLRGAVFPVRDEAGELRFVATATPVSRAAHLEGDLRDAASFYEQAPYALQSLDEGGRILRVNTTWLTWMGYTRDEVEGVLSFKDVITSESYALFLEAFPVFKERGSARDIEFTFRRKDGSTFPGLLSSTAIKDASGRFVRSRAVILDLSARKRAESELAEAKRIADAANKAKSEFLSSMSHELRTPLNAILGFAQLLGRDKSPQLTARQLGYLKHVLRGGEHLLRLIDEVLDLARIESGHVPISVEPVDVEAVLREVSVTLDPMAQSRGVTLALMPLPPDLPQICVDRTRFSQILLNLGSNAIKYNRAGGQVSFVASVTASGEVRVTVSDTGIGIPAERQAELFQPFHRLGQETGSIEGTGIGLAIVKRLVELMGGRVGVHSTMDKGSEFWVEFPAAAITPEERVSSVPRTPAHRELASSEGRRYKALYIEDNPANLALMQELLATLESFELLTAPTAEIGIELARAHRPDIVVLDINLPGMNGFEAIEHLKSSPETRAIPVVALSASAMERDLRRAEQAGFSRYLTKPVKIEELEGALSELVARPRA
ncbi:PAS domain-containing hybrid sensor histidine kinase/response regulator [Polyangium jinanense]|uniref:histidine kinase n=1 Tax=Polyangium jinanense TaxID=2829994 RepID=A0A9X3X0T8_9BACT|nr:ATP-binding protein [Polyangium jinanense]MDC3954407.1 response regulator [Polyangium jinanense]MDC3980710.1 response regulator [Polyangium jinanense]